jgi:hypothetical protein
MPTLSAEGRVDTERASRYLAQLCEHLNQMGHRRFHKIRSHGAAHPGVISVEWSDAHGVLIFTGGQCTLQASADALTLRAEAADADSLQRMQEMLSMRLETIGRRDRLRVVW